MVRRNGAIIRCSRALESASSVTTYAPAQATSHIVRPASVTSPVITWSTLCRQRQLAKGADDISDALALVVCLSTRWTVWSPPPGHAPRGCTAVCLGCAAGAEDKVGGSTTAAYRRARQIPVPPLLQGVDQDRGCGRRRRLARSHPETATRSGGRVQQGLGNLSHHNGRADEHPKDEFDLTEVTAFERDCPDAAQEYANEFLKSASILRRRFDRLPLGRHQLS